MPSSFAPRRHAVMLFCDTFVRGGTERQLIATARGLQRRGYEVHVGCLERSGPFLAEVEALGVPITEFWIKSPYSLDAIRQFFRLVAYLRSASIDVLHAFEFYANIFAVPAARLAGVPVVVASRRGMAASRSRLKRAALSVSSRLAHGILANSDAAAADVEWSVRHKVRVVRNGIDLGSFDAAPRGALAKAAAGLPDTPLVGIVAALRSEKDHPTFLRCARRVLHQHPDAHFVIVGDGAERRRLETLAAELGIASRVLFLGDRRDVATVLGALDTFVLSSVTESFPNAILEAMASGLPVVASRVGGTPELVEHGVSGFLVAPGDDAAFAATIARLLGDPQLAAQVSRAARERVVSRFSDDQAVSGTTALYAELPGKRLPRARVLQIGNFPPPLCGWSMHTELLHRALIARGATSQVLDIGPSRQLGGRDCDTSKGALDYAFKLVRYRARGFTFHAHVNGDSWKGFLLAAAAVGLGRITGKPALLTFHAGPSQQRFPRTHGRWYWAFRWLFKASGEIVCNHEPVKRLIAGYGVSPQKVHAIPAFSTQYAGDVASAPPPAIEQFAAAHSPFVFSYCLFRPEFTSELLLEAIRALRATHPRLGLLIVGPTTIPDDIQRQLRKHSLEDAVQVAGNLPHGEFLAAMKRADVCVRTHLRDGVCSSVLEALALGIPVVAAADGLRPASVVTYDAARSGDLEAKLRQVLEDLPAARRSVVSPVTEDHLSQQVEVVLRVATGAPPVTGAVQTAR